MPAHRPEPNAGDETRRHARFVAPAPLAPEIAGYDDYALKTPGYAARCELPHPDGVLIVNLAEPIEIVGGDGERIRLKAGEAFFAGPHLRPAMSWSEGGQSGVHVHLSLPALRRLIGAPMREYVDRVAPLDALLGRRARDLGQRLGLARDSAARADVLNAALAHLLAEGRPLESSQTFALRLLKTRPDLDVAEVAREIGWSRKHLADRVRDAVGVGPRSYRRLLRFQRLLRALVEGTQAPDWAGLAIDAGYFDQSHMIREFGEFSGASPSSYWRRRLADGGLEAA